MAETSRGRNLTGRLLTGLGALWILWAFFGDLVGLQFGRSLINLPILPGLVIFFIGRAIGRGSRRRADSEEPVTEPVSERVETERPAPIRQPPRPVVPPEPTPRVDLILEPEPEQTSEALKAVEEEIAAAMSQNGPRKSSAEMVAEARRRFGKRP